MKGRLCPVCHALHSLLGGSGTAERKTYTMFLDLEGDMERAQEAKRKKRHTTFLPSLSC